MTAWKNDKSFLQDLKGIFSIMGEQFPAITPAITTPYEVLMYAYDGRPIYDSWRQQTVVPDYYMGKPEAWNYILKYEYQKLGLKNVIGNINFGIKKTDETAMEKIKKIPFIGAGVGAFFSQTKQGEEEAKAKILEKERDRSYKEKADRKEIFMRYIEEYNGSGREGLFARKEYARKAIKEIEEKEGADFDKKDKTVLTTSFTSLLKKNKEMSDDEKDIFYAKTNKEKIALIKYIKDKKQGEQFNDFLLNLKKNEIISEPLYWEIKKLK
jgi:hypothetical protein